MLNLEGETLSNGTLIVEKKVDFIQENISVITSHPIKDVHKRHKSRTDEIEYGICSKCKEWEIVEKHHFRLRGHKHPREQRKKRIQTCPNCHEEFHILADKLEAMILEEYPLKHSDRFSVKALMREHVWEFDELNRRFYELGEDSTDDDLRDIVAEGKKLLNYVKVRR